MSETIRWHRVIQSISGNTHICNTICLIGPTVACAYQRGCNLHPVPRSHEVIDQFLY
jgi:hypothetical protein